MALITPSPSIRLNIRRDENHETSSSLSFVQYTSKQVTKHLPSAVLDESGQTTVTKITNQQHFISPPHIQPDPEYNHTPLTQGDKNKRKLSDRRRKQAKQTYDRLKHRTHKKTKNIDWSQTQWYKTKIKQCCTRIGL